MYLHEFQAKSILEKYKIKCPNRQVINNVSQINEINKRLKTKHIILKAQLYTGSRKKLGGIKICQNNCSSIFNLATILFKKKFLINNELINTNNVLAEELVKHKNEFYISISINKKIQKIMIMMTDAGGIDVEQKKKFIYITLDSNYKIYDYQIRYILSKFNLDMTKFKIIKRFISKLINIYVKNNLILLEINPFTLKKKIICLDAKIEIDDNSEHKYTNMKLQEDKSQINIIEYTAKNFKLNYVKLDGNIGCIVNGAGLAMATVDLIKSMKGEPANFLDVGGSIDHENFINAIKITLMNKKVKVILINIFGGIVRCDIIAKSFINANNNLNIGVPIVIRLEGNESERGISIIKQELPNTYISKDLQEIIKQAIILSKNKI